jgi:hypothetical protein
MVAQKSACHVDFDTLLGRRVFRRDDERWRWQRWPGRLEPTASYRKAAPFFAGESLPPRRSPRGAVCGSPISGGPLGNGR